MLFVRNIWRSLRYWKFKGEKCEKERDKEIRVNNTAYCLWGTSESPIVHLVTLCICLVYNPWIAKEQTWMSNQWQNWIILQIPEERIWFSMSATNYERTYGLNTAVTCHREQDQHWSNYLKLLDTLPGEALRSQSNVFRLLCQEMQTIIIKTEMCHPTSKISGSKTGRKYQYAWVWYSFFFLSLFYFFPS